MKQCIILVLSFFFVILAYAGSQAPENIRRVYSYECRDNFLEGEWVTPNYISCYPGQHLGIYSVNYNFYLFSDDSGRNNFAQRAGMEYYANNNSVCGLLIERYNCNNGIQESQFGLSTVKTEQFSASIRLSPNFYTSPYHYGFAALPDENGDCAEGLVKLNMYVANPPTITAPLPTNFYNVNGNLDSYVITTEDRAPDFFNIYHSANLFPCDSMGYCSPQFQPAVISHSIPYVKQAQTVCVIPR